ncbi:hypothetical protein C2845_PM07G08760 [Panicum miliaceum]|uniref:FAR1 domain-containing protein n=1 Tax=Panicum miliaceum TaxID=4540 RepID=A0A3L6SQV4_PANMI|nr:hypothetical protein C2845_PM07G08760 [Panicum miliaceum]
MAVRGVNLPASWNYGAVERALRGADDRGDRCIFEPELGKVFESTQEAFEFYNMYSWAVGFGIRSGRSRESKGGRRTMQCKILSAHVRVCSIIGSMHGPGGYIPFSRQSMRSVCGRLAQETISNDVEKTISVFESIRSSDPGLVVKVDKDEAGRTNARR